MEWKLNKDAPEMRTLLLYSPKYPSGNMCFGYKADGTYPAKYGKCGKWYDLGRNEIEPPTHYCCPPAPPSFD